jgi:rhomboid protease GluP
VSDADAPSAPRVFDVRFGPAESASWRDVSPNNIELSGAGTLEVTAEHALFSDARNLAPDERRRFALVDIANVEHLEGDTAAQVVAVRTRKDGREVLVWMASRDEALALLELLPKEMTPGFLELQAQYKKYFENLAAIAPKTWVTRSLVGLNLLLFAVMLVMGAGLIAVNSAVHLKFGANYGPLTWHGQPWRLLTSAFIHFGIIHLILNMIALYSGGQVTERLFGSARFAVIYLLSALAGSIASGWWEATRLSAGASGAIFGVYGALLAFFARRPRDIPKDMFKQVSTGAASLLVYSLVLGAAMRFVDNSAHIGGLLAGTVSGFLLVRPFEPQARAVARPWVVAAVIVGVGAVLAWFAAQVIARA